MSGCWRNRVLQRVWVKSLLIEQSTQSEPVTVGIEVQKSKKYPKEEDLLGIKAQKSKKYPKEENLLGIGVKKIKPYPI